MVRTSVDCGLSVCGHRCEHGTPVETFSDVRQPLKLATEVSCEDLKID